MGARVGAMGEIAGRFGEIGVLTGRISSTFSTGFFHIDSNPTEVK